MFRTIVWFIILCPIKVWADSGLKSCLPQATSAQVLWRVPVNSNSELVEALSSKVQLVGSHAGRDVSFRVRFDPTFEGVSLPYNLYAVLVIQNGSVIAWWDYTRACEGPGLSFFPGKEIHLPKVKLVGEDADQLQIMVWGKL